MARDRGYTDQDMAEVSDNPEWTADDFARARPFAEAFPDLAASVSKGVEVVRDEDTTRRSLSPSGDIAALVDEIERVGRTMFEGNKPTTAAVAKAYGDLGIRKGYFVASRTYKLMVALDSASSRKVDGEWLYDLCWYTQEGFFEEMVLVLESELGGRYQTDQVDNDFGKLVQARATVRVWVAQAKWRQMADLHIETCMESARAFRASLSGDVYIFVIYDKATKAVVTKVCKI